MGSLVGSLRDLFHDAFCDGLDTADWTNLILKIVLIAVGATITSVITSNVIRVHNHLWQNNRAISADEFEVISKTFFMYFGIVLGVVVVSVVMHWCNG